MCHSIECKPKQPGLPGVLPLVHPMQEAAMTDELEEACAMLVEAIDLRKKWLFQVCYQACNCC